MSTTPPSADIAIGETPSATAITDPDAALLQAWQLPPPESHGDEDGRGCVLIVGGSRETAGAAMLASVAALRAGAGKLLIATARSVAPMVSVAVREARVIGLANTSKGAFSLRGAEALVEAAKRADTVLIGAGMLCETGTSTFVSWLVAQLGRRPVVLDAMAINALRALRSRPGLLITPHAGQMARLTVTSKEAVSADALNVACRAARRWNAVVALKGAATWVVAPAASAVRRHMQRNPGLATSGSGDVLAGLIVGFAARGPSAARARSRRLLGLRDARRQPACHGARRAAPLSGTRTRGRGAGRAAGVRRTEPAGAALTLHLVPH